jgi:hypothetical protein
VVPIPSVIPVFSVIPTFTPVDISVIRVCERGQNYSRNQRTCLATIERFFNITKALNKILLLFNANGTNKFITTLVNINGVVFKSRATTFGRSVIDSMISAKDVGPWLGVTLCGGVITPNAFCWQWS